MSKILFLLLFFLSWGLCAQEPYALHLNKNKGLPSAVVYNVFQDSKGFIWMATNGGLTRYDGFEYLTYKSATQSSAAGSCIREDRYGRIWYENFDGFLHYVENDSLKGVKRATSYFYIPYGITAKHLITMQQKGIDIYDLKTLELKKTITIEGTKVDHANCDGENFYTFINDTIFRVDKDLNLTKTTFFCGKGEPARQIYFYPGGIYVLSKHNESKQMYLFDMELNFKGTMDIAAVKFIQGSTYLDNKFWIFSSNGLFVYGQAGNYQHWFVSKSISGVLKDRQGNYWFSTTGEGIFLAPDLNNKMHSIKGMLPNRITATQKGFIIGGKKGEIGLLSHNLDSLQMMPQNNENAEVYYIYADTSNDNIFYSSKKFIQIPKGDYRKAGQLELAVKDIYKLDDKYYAFAASGFAGLSLNTAADKSKTSLWDSLFFKRKHENLENTSVLQASIRGKSIVATADNKSIYIASNSGLLKIKYDGTTEEIKQDSTPFLPIKLAVFENKIFALTAKGNLFEITDEKHFELLNLRLKIPEFEIRFMRKVGDQLLLLSNELVYRYNLKSKTYHTDEINIATYDVNDLFLLDNTLIVLTNSGIIEAKPGAKAQKRAKPIFQINSFKANEKRLNINGQAFLNYRENEISVNFSVLDFGATKPVALFYRINDDAWKLVAKESRTLQFPSLTAGTYIVQFRVDDVLSEQQLHFTIWPPFWYQAWFILLCVSVLIAVGYLYYKWQIGLLRNQIKLLRDKVQLEKKLSQSVLTSIKSQMNPHFFYNALNTIQAYIYMNDKSKASSYLAKFSKLTRKILEMSEQDAITLSEELETLKLYLDLEKMRFVEGFTFSFEIDPDIDVDEIKIPSMLIQPYIENAVKHGLLHKETGEKILTVNFLMEQTILKVTIEDNGIGREKSEALNRIKNEKRQSFATDANEKRLEVLNSYRKQKVSVEYVDKKDENGEALGTKVILYIPV